MNIKELLKYDFALGFVDGKLSEHKFLAELINKINADEEFRTRTQIFSLEVEELQKVVKILEIIKSKREETAIKPRRDFLRKVAGLFLATGSALKTAEAQPAIQRYLSPRNNKRARRSRTLLIIIHTTEAGDRSSLNSIYRSGTANYVVATGGVVYNTIEHGRIAKHAGRSMWNNVSNISNVSVGIEVVGYHNRDITSRQYASLRGLLSFLKSVYKLSDNKILTHSMVAYGTPNRFWRRSHRGRKRCGMQFAKPEVREKLGLRSKPNSDPDLSAKRLINADPYLYSVLYGTRQESIVAEREIIRPDSNIISQERSAWLIAKEKYDANTTRYSFPNGQIMFGDQIENQNAWNSIPNGTRVELNIARANIPARPADVLEDEGQETFEGFKVLKQGDTAQSIAGDDYNKYTTIYFLLDGRVRTGAQISPSSFRILVKSSVRVLMGYQYGGSVTSRRLPRDIAGTGWNYPSTFYRFTDGTIRAGDDIDDNSLPRGTIVFFRR